MANTTNPIALDDTLRATNQKLDTLKSAIESSYTNPTSYRTTDSTTVSVEDSDFIPLATIGDATTRKKTLVSTLQEKFWEYVATKLSTVATSGSYSDLKNKPTIPQYGYKTGNILSLNNVLDYGYGGTECKDNNVYYEIVNWYLDLDGSSFVTSGDFEKYTGRLYQVSSLLINDSNNKIILNPNINIVSCSIDFTRLKISGSDVTHYSATLMLSYIYDANVTSQIPVQKGTNYSFRIGVYLP